jgi:hypothetical protein
LLFVAGPVESKGRDGIDGHDFEQLRRRHLSSIITTIITTTTATVQ